MRVRSAEQMFTAIERKSGKDEFTSELFVEMLELQTINYRTFISDFSEFKAAAQIRIKDLGWESKTTLVIWFPHPDPFELEKCVCLLINDKTYGDIVKAVVQTIKLRAFL